MNTIAEKIFPVLPGRSWPSSRVVLLIALALFVSIGSNDSPSASGGSVMFGEGAGWKLEVATSGGFSGKGIGGIALGSDGQVSASSETRACPGKLLPEEVTMIERLVRKASPGRWRKSYTRPGNPRGYADQFQYTFKLSIDRGAGSRTYETYWYDETGDRLPADLDKLVKEAWKIRDRVMAKC